MSNSASRTKRYVRMAATLLGTSLLAYLVVRAGSHKLLDNARAIGWGIFLVLGLAGISHIVKTWAWRLTLPGQFDRVPFSRTLGLRLVSEAIGQFGFVGQVVGDATRGSLLTSELPVSSIISSVALDRGLFMVSGLIVAVAGFVSLAFVSTIPRGLRLCSSISALVMLILLCLSVEAVRRGWPLLSGTVRAAKRLPWLRNWLGSKEAVILSAEEQLLNFHSRTPSAFWTSTVLNFIAHGLAVGEVYLILVLMGSKIGPLGALMLESLTKLINVIGMVNPGNVGTYEGGNMAIVKLVGLAGGVGLTLGLCRRCRSIFWAIIGGLCLLYFSRSRQGSQTRQSVEHEMESNSMSAARNSIQTPSLSKVAIILANQSTNTDASNAILAEVGAVPLLLRAILSAKNAGISRIIIVVDEIAGAFVHEQLLRTGRLPAPLEWVQVPSKEWLQVQSPAAAISMVLGQVAADAESIFLIAGDRSYHPSLYKQVSEWNVDGSALELVSDGQLVGLTALSRELALDVARDEEFKIGSIDELHQWLRTRHAARFGPTVVYCETVPEGKWQTISNEKDRLAAEKKLESWLVKPTDGIFARMNRKVSIPISRQLIKLPITPNMVSLFTLGVSFASGVYFGLGGYWNALMGAILSVWASILDGCDGEVARMKLQVSDFGCWLDTICDYLYYIFLFGGMTIGLARSTGERRFLVWGAALFFGAIGTFIIAGLGRKRLSGERPEQYLAVWQKKAESRLSNPLIYIGRYTEFIVRRCFLPYALLALAVLNLSRAALYVSAIGANIAWIISLRSYIAFSAKPGPNTVHVEPSAAADNALAV